LPAIPSASKSSALLQGGSGPPEENLRRLGEALDDAQLRLRPRLPANFLRNSGPRLEPGPISSISPPATRWAEAQATITGNIANVNTPGYGRSTSGLADVMDETRYHGADFERISAAPTTMSASAEGRSNRL
jgi:hypothetical protein